MIKQTLLQVVQTILSAMNSDEVNSIGDTSESLQVAECVRTSYHNMMGRYDLPEHNQPFQLTPSNDPTKPTLMYKPDGVNRVEWLKYFDSNPADGLTQVDQFGAFSHGLNVDIIPNPPWSTTSTTTNSIANGTKTFTVVNAAIPAKSGQSVQITANSTNLMFGIIFSFVGNTMVINVTSSVGSGSFSNWTIASTAGGNPAPPGYIDVCLITPKNFIDMVSTFNTLNSDVGTFTLTVPSFSTGAPSTFTFNYKNNRQPQYYTIISNDFFIFDSFDATQDDTLQSSKTMAYGWVMPDFQMTDNFIINLDQQQFPLLLNEAKSLAFLELKQQPHPKAEKEVLRQLSSLQKFKALGNRPSPFEDLPNFGRRIGTGGYALYKQSNPLRGY